MARKGSGLYLRKDSWWLDCRISGVRHVVKLGKGISRTVAAELATVQRTRILRGESGIGKKKKDLSFAEARAKFEAWANANTKPNTVQTYKECLRRLAETFGAKRLSDIAPFHVEAHKQKRIQAGARVRPNRELAVLKAVFNRCLEWRLFEGANPVQSVKLVKEPKGRVRFLSVEEEHRLLQAAPEPLRSIILVGIHTGLRIQAEALTLKWADVDLVRRTLTVQAAYSKNGHTRTVPLNSVAYAALARLKAQAKSEYVFTTRDQKPYSSIRNGFESACTRAGLTDVVPHTLRHSFATRLIESGVDLRAVQELGGWSSLRMLERYGHVTATRKAHAVEQLVTEFHNAFHNSPQRAETEHPITYRKIKRGEVAEWPKATVC